MDFFLIIKKTFEGNNILIILFAIILSFIIYKLLLTKNILVVSHKLNEKFNNYEKCIL